MTKSDIYQRFITEYPHFKQFVSVYKKNGKNSIIIQTNTNRSMVFRVEGKNGILTSI